MNEIPLLSEMPEERILQDLLAEFQDNEVQILRSVADTCANTGFLI